MTISKADYLRFHQHLINLYVENNVLLWQKMAVILDHARSKQKSILDLQVKMFAGVELVGLQDTNFQKAFNQIPFDKIIPLVKPDNFSYLSFDGMKIDNTLQRLDVWDYLCDTLESHNITHRGYVLGSNNLFFIRNFQMENWIGLGSFVVRAVSPYIYDNAGIHLPSWCSHHLAMSGRALHGSRDNNQAKINERMYS